MEGGLTTLLVVMFSAFVSSRQSAPPDAEIAEKKLDRNLSSCSFPCNTTMNLKQMWQLLEDLNDIQKAHQKTQRKAILTALAHLDKINALEAEFNTLSVNVGDYYETLNNLFGHLATAFNPQSKSKSITDQAICPLISCYKSHRMSQRVAKTAKIISAVAGVTSKQGCAMLCSQNNKCQAVRYTPNTRLCNLIESLNILVDEGERKPTIELLVKASSKLGKCSSRFNLRYKSSHYKFYRSRVTWAEGRRKCEAMGYKLAELSTPDEVSYLRRTYMARRIAYWFVGGIQLPRSGDWYWYYSKIPIPTPGFSWKRGSPDKYTRNEHVIIGEVVNGSIVFDDVARYAQVDGFLCECITLK